MRSSVKCTVVRRGKFMYTNFQYKLYKLYFAKLGMVQTISTPPVATASLLQGKSQNPLDTDMRKHPANADKLLRSDGRSNWLAQCLQPNYCAELKPTQTPSQWSEETLQRQGRDCGGVRTFVAGQLAKEPAPSDAMVSQPRKRCRILQTAS